ncbi:hypothetical protein [Streptomyces synnematoformans]
MTGVEYESPIRKVRDEIASVVDRAKDDSVITYVTRNGERVAAVVPLPVAERGTRHQARAAVDSEGRPLRPPLSAPGGRFGLDAASGGAEPSPEELRWTRTALEALHAHLAGVTAETAGLLAVVGQALAAVSDRHMGTVAELLESLDGRFEAPGAALSDAEDLYYELIHPDDALCATCREPIGMFFDHDGWQHHRTVVNELTGLMTKTEIYEPEDGHDPQPVYVPRDRPAIDDGRVVIPPPERAADVEAE